MTKGKTKTISIEPGIELRVGTSRKSYRVNKMINGTRYTKSFKELKEAKDFLNSLENPDPKQVLASEHPANKTVQTKEPRQELGSDRGVSDLVVVQDLIDYYKRFQLGIDPETNEDIPGSEAEQAGADFNIARKAYLRFWSERIGSVNAAKLPIRDINTALEKLRAEKAKSTVNKYRDCLSAVYTFIIAESYDQPREGYEHFHNLIKEQITQNPVNHAKRYKLLQGEGVRDATFSDKEKKAFLDACRESKNPWVYPMALISFETGCRLGEVKLLQWEWINLTPGHAEINFKSNKEGRADKPVPLSENGLAVHYLRQMYKERDRWKKHCFPRPNKDKPRDCKNALERIYKRAGIDGSKGKKLTFHSIRHTFCTRWAEAGYPESVLIKYTGHSSDAIKRYYNHTAEKQRDMGEVALKKMYS